MNDRIYAEKEFKIGTDFELQPLKKVFRKVQIFKGGGNDNSVDRQKGKEAKGSKLQGLQYMNLGFTIAIPIFLGLALGLYIDGLLHSRPIATILMVLLGVVSSFYNLWKTVQ